MIHAKILKNTLFKELPLRWFTQNIRYATTTKKKFSASSSLSVNTSGVSWQKRNENHQIQDTLYNMEEADQKRFYFCRMLFPQMLPLFSVPLA